MVYEQHLSLLDNKDRDGEIDLVVNMRHGMFPPGASKHARHSPEASGLGCDAGQEYRTIARQPLQARTHSRTPEGNWYDRLHTYLIGLPYYRTGKPLGTAHRPQVQRPGAAPGARRSVGSMVC